MISSPGGIFAPDTNLENKGTNRLTLTIVAYVIGQRDEGTVGPGREGKGRDGKGREADAHIQTNLSHLTSGLLLTELLPFLTNVMR